MQISERLNAVFHCAGYSQNSVIGLTFRADSHQHQHQIETFLFCAGCLRIIHFPYPNILIPSFLLVNKQMSSVFAKHPLTFLFSVWMNTNVSITTNLKCIYVYCLQYVCMCMSVSVCVMFALAKLHVTNRRCLTLWETTELRISWMAPLLSVVQTVVVPWASGRRGSSWAEEFHNLLWSIPTDGQERGHPRPCVTKGHEPGVAATSQENLSGGKTVMTNQQSQPEMLFMPVSQPGQSEKCLDLQLTLLCQLGLAKGSWHPQTEERK